VVAEDRERLAVNKQRSHRFHAERFSFNVEWRVKSNSMLRFSALENLAAEVDVISAWVTLRQNIKISTKDGLGYYELKKHKPWFNEGCPKLLDQRKQASLQWFQDPSQINWDDLNRIRREVSKRFKGKKG
jgi:hypothetical protein